MGMFVTIVVACIFSKLNCVSTSGCTNSPMDIVLLLDSSDGQTHFDEEKQFSSRLINDLWDGSNRFGMITFGSTPNIQFDLETYQSVSETQLAVEYIWQSSGKAEVGKALDYSINHGFQEINGGRRLAPDVVLLITSSDIYDKSYIQNISLAAASTGSQLYVVLVGYHISTFWYEKLTTKEKIIKVASETNSLMKELGNVKSSICKGRGILREWSEWTVCGSLCGPGLRRRFRKCEKRKPIDIDCDGELMHEERCFNTPCTKPVDGSWSFWDDWTDCSKTCGNGTQIKTRTCTAPFPENGGKTCPGNSKKSKSCAEWPCPDCSRTCPAGTKLSLSCDVCTATGIVLFGYVRSFLNRTIEGAHIFVKSKMYESLTTSDEYGFFSVHGVYVADETIAIRRKGYSGVDGKAKQVNQTHYVFNSTMLEEVAPLFLLHPTSKKRLVGQSVSICCRATGQPPPAIYTWYKGLESLGTRGLNGTLVFRSVSLSDKGEYYCSTETDAGSSTSNKATLTVSIGATDTCERPKPLYEALPDGCYVKDDMSKNSTINVGTCGQDSCVTKSLADNFTCTEWWPHYCCDSNADASVDVQCDGFQYKASIVSSCTCRKCYKKTVITGNAFGRAENGSILPLKFGTIYVYGKQKAMTNIVGYFSFEIPFDFEKIIVRFADNIYKTFIDTTKNIELEPGKSTSISIALPLRPKKIEFRSDSEFAVQVGSSKGLKSPGGITIPRNSLCTVDGVPYIGKANAQVHFMDPRILEDFEASSGEFSFQEEGENCPLETYGVIKTNFEDDKGNQLILNKPIQFEIDPTVMNISNSNSGDPNVELWKFDENTGTWKSVDKMKSKVTPFRRRLLDQMYVGSDTSGQYVPPIELEHPAEYATKTVLDYTKEVARVIYYKYYYGAWWWRKYNIDTRVITSKIQIYKTVTTISRAYSVERGACFVRVAVFSDLSGNTIAKDMVSVTAVTKDILKDKYKGFETQPIKNGRKCLKIFCDSEVYLYAEKDGSRLIAFPKHDLPYGYNSTNIKNSTEVVLNSRNFETVGGRNGPVYYFEDEKECTASPDSFEFRFGMRFGKDPKLNLQVSENIYDNKQSWHPVPPDNDNTLQVCYLKVMLKIQGHFDIRLIGISRKENASREQYGMYNVAPQPDKTYSTLDERAACVEFRCPGIVNDAGKITKNVATHLEVRLNPKPKIPCRIRPLNKNISITEITSGYGFDFLAEAEDSYGPKYGVYIYQSSKTNAQNFCFQGTNSGSFGNGMLPSINAAVEIDCL